MSFGGILFAVAVLIVSIVMLRSVFHKAVAWLGVASGIVGIACESLRPLLGAIYGIYGILFIWFVVVGWKLLRLGTGKSR